MSNMEACLICEGAICADENQITAAWQHLIDTGLAWELQGFFGREAERLIALGVCQA
jgi:hypothetical protein